MERTEPHGITSTHVPLLPTGYLRTLWGRAFQEFESSPASKALLVTLRQWAEKDWQNETAAEGAFIDVFFKGIWGYTASGQGQKGDGYTLAPRFPVKRAGAGGNTGAADIALGDSRSAFWLPATYTSING